MEQQTDTDKVRKQTPARGHMVDVGILSSLSGEEIIDRIIEAPDPRALVRGLAHGDFYWLVKKIGINDCLPILEAASEEQWQYLLDMELWQKDRLDLNQAAMWLSRLRMADPRRLAKWLLSEGQATAYYFFYRSVDVAIKKDEDPDDFPDGFFTLDGTYYIRVKDPGHRLLIEELLRFLAGENLLAYQSLLLGLAGVLPAEAEEDLYRMRGVRLAEHGFLPFEEAVSIYSPMNPKILGTDELPAEPEVIRTEGVPGELVPFSPFSYLDKGHVLVSAVRGFSDPMLHDRIYLEFAGLCNQILSADSVIINNLDVLVKACRKAAGYVSLSLEKTCSGDVHRAAQILKKHSLVSLFRVGFGLVLQLKWDIARWMKDAWFTKRGLDLDFWGDEWGETIGGLLFEKPLFYCGTGEDAQYCDFRGLADFEKCRQIFRNVRALDYLFSRLSERIPMPEWNREGEDVTFHPLLFNVWVRDFLGSRLSFEGIPIARAREVFSRLRAGEEKAPYRMSEFKDVFVKDMLRLGAVRDEGRTKLVTKVLLFLWHRFCAEYENITLEDLDQRFSRYLTIMSSPEADFQ